MRTVSTKISQNSVLLRVLNDLPSPSGEAAFLLSQLSLAFHFLISLFILNYLDNIAEKIMSNLKTVSKDKFSS